MTESLQMERALPLHLAGQEASGFQPGQAVCQYELGPMNNFVYLILDEATREAAIVDPARDLRPVDDLIRNGYRLTRCLLTHSHHDHVAGLAPLLARFPELPVHVHEQDRFRLRDLATTVRLETPSDGDVIQVGGISARLWHTPGHSPGECCYLVEAAGEKYLISGDTLFIRDCGRTDFAESDNDAMFASLARLRTLPPETILLPGHHYARECASRLGREFRESPPLLCRTAQELKELP